MFTANDALVVVGGRLWLDRHIGLAAEAGFQNTNIPQGVIAKGSALALFRPLAGSVASPFLFGGVSGARLGHIQCTQTVVQAGTGYAGFTTCQNDYLDTGGTIFGVGQGNRILSEGWCNVLIFGCRLQGRSLQAYRDVFTAYRKLARCTSLGADLM